MNAPPWSRVGVSVAVCAVVCLFPSSLFASTPTEHVPPAIAPDDGILSTPPSEDSTEFEEFIPDHTLSVEERKAIVGDRGNEFGAVDQFERMRLVSELLFKNEYEEATEELLWTWKHSRAFAQGPFTDRSRLENFSHELDTLVNAHPPAREVFTRLRDVIEDRLRGDEKTYLDLGDWILLNEALGDAERTVVWAQRVKDSPGAGRTFDLYEREIEDAFLENGLWREYGEILINPVAAAQRDVAFRRHMRAMEERMPDLGPPTIVANTISWKIEGFARRWASLEAADRQDEANGVWIAALQLSDSATTRITFLRTAVRAGVLRDAHRTLLDEAEQIGGPRPALREILEERWARRHMQ